MMQSTGGGINIQILINNHLRNNLVSLWKSAKHKMYVGDFSEKTEP